MGSYYSSSKPSSSIDEQGNFYIDSKSNITEGDKHAILAAKLATKAAEELKAKEDARLAQEIRSKSSEKNKNVDLSLEEADKILDSSRRSLGAARQARRQFSDIEASLYNCYAANKDQTLKCKEVVNKYKRFVSGIKS